METGTVISIVTLLVSLLSLFVAIKSNGISQKNAKKQHDLEMRTYSLEERGLAAEHLKKYEQILSDSYSTVYEARSDLGKIAGSCYREILNCFNPYRKYNEEHNTHVFDEICFQIVSNLRVNLGSSKRKNLTGMKLRMQLNNLQHFPIEEITPEEKALLQARRSVEPLLLKTNVENIGVTEKVIDITEFIMNSARLQILIREFKSLFPPDKLEKVYENCLEKLEPYFNSSKYVRPVFLTEFVNLKWQYENNRNFGQVKLDESNFLSNKFKQEMARNDQLNALHADDMEIEMRSRLKNPDAIQTLIYIGTVLCALEAHEEWGEG